MPHLPFNKNHKPLLIAAAIVGAPLYVLYILGRVLCFFPLLLILFPIDIFTTIPASIIYFNLKDGNFNWDDVMERTLVANISFRAIRDWM